MTESSCIILAMSRGKTFITVAHLKTTPEEANLPAEAAETDFPLLLRLDGRRGHDVCSRGCHRSHMRRQAICAG